MHPTPAARSLHFKDLRITEAAGLPPNSGEQVVGPGCLNRAPCSQLRPQNRALPVFRHRLEVDGDSEGGAAVDVPCKGTHDLRPRGAPYWKSGVRTTAWLARTKFCIGCTCSASRPKDVMLRQLPNSDLLVLRQDHVERVKPWFTSCS